MNSLEVIVGKSAVKVELCNPNKFYSPGQTVKGRVLVYLNKSDKVKDVSAELRGEFVLHKPYKEDNLNVPTAVNKVIRHATCSEQREVLVHRHIAKSPVILSSEVQLLMETPELTIYARPFQLILPKDVPSSFKNKWGWVYYGVDATLKSLELSTKSSQEIRVLSPVNLNRVRGCNLAVHLSALKLGNIFLGREGSITFIAKLLSGSGYVAGEAVHFEITAENESNKKVTSMEAYIRQELTCTDNIKTFKRDTIVAKLEHLGLAPGRRVLWKSEELRIPQLPTTTFEKSRGIVDIQYFFHVKMHLPGIAEPLTKHFPIVIGTVALNGEPQDFTPAPSAPATVDDAKVDSEDEEEDEEELYPCSKLKYYYDAEGNFNFGS